jgi:hypothetical protein
MCACRIYAHVCMLVRVPISPCTHFMQCGMCSSASSMRQLRHCTAAPLLLGDLKSSSSDANWPQISRGQNMRGAGSSSMSSCRGVCGGARHTQQWMWMSCVMSARHRLMSDGVKLQLLATGYGNTAHTQTGH